MRTSARCYEELRGHLETIPLVDCHDHAWEMGPKPTDAIKAVLDWYMRSDLLSASSEKDVELIFNEKKTLEERWPVLERAWSRTKYTGYALVVRRAIRRFYGEEELTLAALRRIQEKMIDFSDPVNYERVLDDAKIRVRLEDIGAGPSAGPRGACPTAALTPGRRAAIAARGLQLAGCTELRRAAQTNRHQPG